MAKRPSGTSRTGPAVPTSARPASEGYRSAQQWLINGSLLLGLVLVPDAVVNRFSLPRAALYAGAAALLAAVSALRAASTGKVLLSRSIVVAFAALFVLVLGLQTVAHDDVMRSVVGPYGRYTGFAMYAAYAGIMVAVVRSHDHRSIRSLAATSVAALGFVSLYGLVQLADADPVAWPEPARAEGLPALPSEFATFGNVNFAAGFVGIVSPLALWAALDSTLDRRLRVASALVLVAAAGYAVGNGSAQGPLAFAAGAVVVGLGWLLAPERRARVAAVRRWLLGIVVLGAMVAAWAVWGYVGGQLDDAGGRERRQMWDTAIEIWSDAPLVGHGIGAFAERFPTERPPQHAASNNFLNADAPHNVVLDMLVSGGLVLAAAYLALVVATAVVLVRGLIRVESPQRWILAGFGGAWAAYQVQSLVSVDVPPIAILHWVLTGAVVVLAGPGSWTALRVPGAPARRGRGRNAAPVAAPAALAIAAVTLVVVWLISVPVRADAAANAANHHRVAGQFAEMLDDAARATDLAPWEATYWALRAAAHDGAGDLQAARDAGIEAAERNEGSAFYALAIAALAQRLDDAGAKERWLREAQRRDPHNPQVQAVVEQASSAP